MKKNKKIFFYGTLLFTIISVAVMGFVLVNGFLYASPGEVPLSPSLQKTFSRTAKENPDLYPKELRIPAIGVDAKVQEVGITKNNNMATPNNFTDVGWFKYGVLPGQIGSAIIAGHVNDGFALPAVFGNLNDLRKGDNIYLDTVGGDTIHFVVAGIETYDYNAPTVGIFDQKNGSFLKLITCAGVWVEKYKTHDKRLVVTAIKVT
jgi:sortase A